MNKNVTEFLVFVGEKKLWLNDSMEKEYDGMVKH